MTTKRRILRYFEDSEGVGRIVEVEQFHFRDGEIAHDTHVLLIERHEDGEWVTETNIGAVYSTDGI